MCVAHVGSFHRRTLFERLGQFDQTYPIVGDYEFLLRAGPQLKAAFLDAVTAEMAAGGQSDSAAALKEGKLAKRQHRVSSNWNSQWEYLVAMAKFRYGRRVRQMLCQH
jgi:glycosyltransferase